MRMHAAVVRSFDQAPRYELYDSARASGAGRVFG